MDYLSPYVPVLVLLLLAGVMCVAIAVLATVLGPRRHKAARISSSAAVGSAIGGRLRRREVI